MRASVSLTIALSTAVESPVVLVIRKPLVVQRAREQRASPRACARMLSSAMRSASSGVSDTASEYFHFALNSPTPDRQSTVPRFASVSLMNRCVLRERCDAPAARREHSAPATAYRA